MNYVFSSNFVILHYLLISTVYSCIKFRNSSDGRCTVSYVNFYQISFQLKCIIINPFLQIESIKCNNSFKEISFKLFSLSSLDNFFLKNNQTVFDIFKLYYNSSNGYCSTNIELVRLSSPPNSINISIDKQFISKMFFHNIACPQYLLVNITAKDWTRIYLSINENIQDIDRSYMFQLNLYEYSLLCKKWFIPQTAIWPYYISEDCSNYITLIDRSTYAFSVLDSFSHTSEKQLSYAFIPHL